MVVYINENMGLTDRNVPTMLEKECIEVKQEVMGTVQMVEKCFLLYREGGSDYNYNRGMTFGQTLPKPPYIPANGPPEEGWFEYLVLLNENTLTFAIEQGPILDAVPEFKGNEEFEALESIEGFAQAADDTRATIEFMHSWPVPGDYATPVSCEVSGALFYDVSISDDSGLQVPVRMVADTEGREGIVTVANAGPAEAAGTVMVVGIDTDGSSIGPFYTLDDEGIPTEETIFTEPEDFVIPAGHSQSWTFFFSMDYATEITWTATAEAEDDVNLNNNEVNAVTVVKSGGGGGGGH